MCGIAGVVLSAPTPDRDFLVRMRDTMTHRGPDDAGVWWSADGLTGLAHRRLAIIDLSAKGHQPMVDESGELCITFNGEIYNYKELRAELEQRGHHFRTATDTEVILEAYRAWGDKCLDWLNGMFAFALYDARTRQLFLARDRAGEKPLYYARSKGGLLFASELKALMAAPNFTPEIDVGALRYYLRYGYVPGELCILKDVAKLPQAHAVSYAVDTGALKVWRYWELPAFHPQKQPTLDELSEELENLLLDSVRLRLIADVPVGILLSGGIDSSLVTALAARASSRTIRSFTISFPDSGVYDEAAHAEVVAKHFGTEHTELVAEPATVDLLEELAIQFDEPLADSSLLPTYLVSRLIRTHATVALGGDGGDELFGGYPYYNSLQQHQWIRRTPEWFRSSLRAAAGQVLSPGFRGRNYLLGLTGSVSQAIAHNGVYFDEFLEAELLDLPKAGWSATEPSLWKQHLVGNGQSSLRQATETDFRSYLVDDVLVKVDRASMLTSLEVRAPWLDSRIIEFAFGRVPDSLRATATACKVLPRALARRLLPAQLDLSRKQGFSLPLQKWFKGKWGDYIRTTLLDAEPGLFDRTIIEEMIAGQAKGYTNTHRLFALTMFELWRRHYKIALLT